MADDKLTWIPFALLVIVVALGLVAWKSPQGDAVSTPRSLMANVWISGQIEPQQLAGLAAQGFRRVVDLRPDGEVAGQPTAAQVEQAARAAGVDFTYVPVAHGAIAPASVQALGQALAAVSGEQKVLLYCASGRRAARTWALAEAAREGGPDAQTIIAALQRLTLPVDDLEGEIAARIAARAAH